jgi:Na+/melibiose symporter-like transporter
MSALTDPSAGPTTGKRSVALSTKLAYGFGALAYGVKDTGFAFFLAAAALVRTCITFYEIPSTSLVAELTDNYDERTSLLSLRFFFGWWGGLTMAVLAYLVFLPQSKGGVLYEDGYRTYGLVSAAIMAFAMLVSGLGTHRHIPHLKQPPPPQPFDLGRTRRELSETLANRSFLALFFSAISTAMAAGAATSLNVYFATFFWEFETWQIGLLATPGFLSAAIALVAAPLLSARLGKKFAGVLVSGLAFLFAPMPLALRLLDAFFNDTATTEIYTLLGFNAFEVSLIITASILISAMVADVVEESELQTGRRSEGVFFAARSFAQKAVHGLGTFTASMILLAVAFPTDAKPGEVDPDTMRGLAVVYIPVLMVLYTCALGFLTMYRISREAHAENLRRLAEPAET